MRIIDNDLCEINRLILKNKSVKFMEVNRLAFQICLVFKNKSINFVDN